LKRAWTKEVKAVLACAADNDAPRGTLRASSVKGEAAGHLSCDDWLGNLSGSDQPFTDSRNCAPAAEPVGNEPTVPAHQLKPRARTKSVEPEAVSGVPPLLRYN